MYWGFFGMFFILFFVFFVEVYFAFSFFLGGGIGMREREGRGGVRGEEKTRGRLGGREGSLDRI